ncbi:glutamine synthetase family protein (plasmid) [Rhizobium sp. CB3060]|uniref:glutamine synthetase family protein n=1 Tax=Rhizobium sp. CB3060 TaxID=3138255 RepID=UPI0021A56E17|nr:glutamine synthetase family protein [Rhizobium tropici]UWU25823.1 glutamine synthetase family protein [Rhizobium tropici]
MTPDELQTAVANGEIDTVIVAMTDMQGRLIGKRLTARFFLETSASPQLFCDYFLATDMEMTLVPGYESASWEKGYGDFALVPDMSTLRAIPWLPKTALVLSDVTTSSGVPLEHSPRQVLRRQLDQLEKLGFAADMAAELEFYLFNQTFDEARSSRYENLKFSSWYPEDGHIFQTSKDEPYIRAIRNLMERADIPVEGSKAECSPGQQEINLQYAEALETCDRLVLYKNGCKEIAHQMGKSVSFMAKLGADLSGNSCHIHLSLRSLKDGTPGFHDATADDGMSTLFKHFLAGAIKHAPAATYFYAPNVNSYKRFTAGTFAPTRLAWSVDNRTTAFRVLGKGKSIRFECRVPGADANPYLAFAALIASGLRGLAEKLPLEEAFAGDAYTADNVARIPRALYRSLDALERSDEFHKSLGDEVVRHYLHCGRWELGAFEGAVTDWEKLRLFERC